jgi:hypothetical protein
LYDIDLQFPTNIAASLKKRLKLSEFDLVNRYLVQPLQNGLEGAELVKELRYRTIVWEASDCEMKRLTRLFCGLDQAS